MLSLQLVLSLAIAVAPPPPPDTVVVCPATFQAALEPWLDYRQEQGHVIRLIGAESSPLAIREQIKATSTGGKLRFVVLVGDAQANPIAPGPQADTSGLSLLVQHVPTQHVPAVVTLPWGGGPTIATDGWYGDFDDDWVPDVAVGRLAVDSPAELATVVKKTLAYERHSRGHLWRRRINLIAGEGGFGHVLDSAIEASARNILTCSIPDGYVTSMTYARWQSPYCPSLEKFHDTVVGRFNEGCLFWIYMGHGRPSGLDRIVTPRGQHRVFEVNDLGKLASRSGAPIALLLACQTGAFDLPEDCLAEEMLQADGGPVAAICGSRVTMPYGMAVLATELAKACFADRTQTVGEMLLAAKRNAANSAPANEWRQALDGVASLLSPTMGDLRAERMEHLALFNLLGDPLLRIRHPLAATLAAPAAARCGDELVVSLTSPISGAATLELALPRDRLAFTPPARMYPATDGADRGEFVRTYRRANQSRLTSLKLDLEPGTHEVHLNVPRFARGQCSLRVIIEGEADFAVGSANVHCLRE